MIEQIIRKKSCQTDDTLPANKHYNKHIKILLIFAGILFSILLVIYLILSLYFSKHFYNHTMINGINVSNMTPGKVEAVINSDTNSYILKLLGRNDLSDQIIGADINLHTDFEGGIDKLLAKQSGFGWPISLFRFQKLKIKTMLTYDKPLLKKYFDKLKFFDESNIVEPKNACISEYTDKGYEIIPENSGTVINKDELYKNIEKAILSLSYTLSIEETGCYNEAEINHQNPKLIKAVKKLNKISGTKITYKFGDATEVLDGSQISKWLFVNDDYKVSLNQDRVKEYVDYIGKTYNTFGKVRTFKTSYGNQITIKGGDYGWWLNRGAEKAELINLIENGKNETKKPTYFQKAQQYGEDDIGNTYVEINLDAQHLFFYKDGLQILDADIVSGNVINGNETPTGTYPIQYKESDATLEGEDYSTPVKYWMPFNSNIGLHDADWRHGDFGGDIYVTGGSHGCINMPPDAAKTVFENVKKGIAVVVYKLNINQPQQF